MSEQYNTQQTIFAIFREEEQVDIVIRRLFCQGVPRDYISAIGKKFQSQALISGFIPKRDVILSGIGKGEIFNSLFRPCFSLLNNVGIQFIPFVGSVVIAGPISRVLLETGKTTSESPRFDLQCALVPLGTPADKVKLYQTRLEEGDYLIIVEVPSDRTAVFQLILEGSGGEIIHISDCELSQPSYISFERPQNFPAKMPSHLLEKTHSTFIKCHAEGQNEVRSKTKLNV
jgi:hypothetical protein